MIVGKVREGSNNCPIAWVEPSCIVGPEINVNRTNYDAFTELGENGGPVWYGMVYVPLHLSRTRDYWVNPRSSLPSFSGALSGEIIPRHQLADNNFSRNGRRFTYRRGEKGRR